MRKQINISQDTFLLHVIKVVDYQRKPYFFNKQLESNEVTASSCYSGSKDRSCVFWMTIYNVITYLLTFTKMLV